MIPLLLTDRIGDDHGLGYGYPQAGLYSEVGFADLTGFEALERDGRLVLRVRLARYANPLQAPKGFSLAVVGVYLDTQPGGSEELPGAGFKTPKGQGWDQAVLLTGWGAEQRDPGGATQALELRRSEDWLEVVPELPPGDYGYYVTVGLYDPFTPWRFRPTRPGGSAWTLNAPVDAPAAVDVLANDQAAAYQSGVLPPVRATIDRKLWTWVAAGAGLLTFLLAFLIPRRRPATPKPPRRPRGQGKAKKDEDIDIDFGK
ncbi:MAG: hypothetical protein C4333_09585 [Meiothermus sp.]